MTHLKIITLILCSLIMLQCSSPTESPITKNPREYTWTVDTLYYPGSLFTVMYRIWGTSANNIYAIGDCQQSEGRIWHFNGQKWSNLVPTITSSNYYYRDVFGFSEDDIWVVGEIQFSNQYKDSCLVIHYNGSDWQKMNVPAESEIMTVGGNSVNDVWFGGTNSYLLHWDGISIKLDSLPINIPKDSANQYFTYRISRNQSGESNFLVINTHLQKAYILEYKNASWNKTYEENYFHFINDFWRDENQNIYKVDYSGFYELMGNSWRNLIGGASLEAIAATSSNNIFIVGQNNSVGHGLVYHYNGKDFYLYENLMLNALYLDAWTNGMEVFIIGRTNTSPLKTIILHGK